jgi:hypothetical protein
VSQRDAFFFSKMALLELCGWIEQSMDDVVLRSTNRVLPKQAYRNLVIKKVDRCYGFKYKDHFREMLIYLHGVAVISKMEASVDQANFQKMKGALTQLKGDRDSHAHTHAKAAIPSVNAPSVTKRLFNDVLEGLLEIDGYLRKSGY